MGEYRNTYVQLIVYDVLGNEIATLVNRNLPAGEYEVSFNTSDLTSRAYLYRLSVDNFSEMKKMILIK
jgi:hypothetical protein